jgi:hypothetical protein
MNNAFYYIQHRSFGGVSIQRQIQQKTLIAGELV